MTTEKKCARCDRVRPLDEFGRNKNMKDGHAAYCFECAVAYRKEWGARAGLPERGVVPREGRCCVEGCGKDACAWYPQGTALCAKHMADRIRIPRRKVAA